MSLSPALSNKGPRWTDFKRCVNLLVAIRHCPESPMKRSNENWSANTVPCEPAHSHMAQGTAPDQWSQINLHLLLLFPRLRLRVFSEMCLFNLSDWACQSSKPVLLPVRLLKRTQRLPEPLEPMPRASCSSTTSPALPWLSSLTPHGLF